ncbi:MAG: protein-tyrosine-phosphatase [Novosphingobium sp.]|nr:protein-tyrosine-phosphatase [Novosphingobium sp.]
MADNRVLALVGVHNFRDFGGYSVAGGGRLKRGKLWRSGQHHDATEADLASIAALGLTAVYDLRTAQERSSHPCARPADFIARVRYSEVADPRNAPHVEVSKDAQGQRDAVSTREGMRRGYETLPFRPSLGAMTRTMLADLADGEDAILVNCMAGKDRTGLAVAAVHLAVGVHRDDVIADYLLTNTAGDTEARIRAGQATIRQITGPITDDVVRALMGVEAAYLETAFAALRERYGSEDAWLEQHLGADGALRERLRTHLVEN